jgi:hypothetical protein
MVLAGALGGSLVALGCGIYAQKKLASVPPAIVIYDDMCRLQEYHDTMASGQGQPPKVTHDTEILTPEAKEPMGGRTTFAFETSYQLKTLHRLLTEHWGRVPAEVMSAERLTLEVFWGTKASVRRVVTNADAVIGVPSGRQFDLPYHACLSELLFGEALYKTRRAMLGLPPVEPVTVFAPDGGGAAAVDGGTPEI